MTGLFGRRFADLRVARAFLQREVERTLTASTLDIVALRGLRQMAQDLKQDAHSLLVTLLFENAAPTLTDAADELFVRFCEIVQQVDTISAQEHRVT